MCGSPLPVGLVSLTVLRVTWSDCCDSLIDAPKKDEKKKVSLTLHVEAGQFSVKHCSHYCFTVCIIKAKHER